MKFTHVVKACPLCGRPNDQPYNGGYGLHVKIDPKYHRLTSERELSYIACRCGLSYAQVYLSPQDNKQLYISGDYREYASGGRDAVSDIAIDDAKHANLITAIIYPNIERAGSILDVGCSSGVLLRQLGEHYNARIMGVEPNVYLHPHLAKNRTPYVDDIDDLPEGDKYDLIILSHVLEHVLDPLEMLTKIRAHLARGGRLFVQVPLLMPGFSHPLVFTEASATFALFIAGYQVEIADSNRHYSIIAR